MRQQIYDLISEIKPFDSLETEHIRSALEWIDSGAPLFRVGEPDIPSKHLVSYFVLFDADKQSIMLIDHVKSGLWLPNGGHIHPGEHPNDTIIREAQEELNIKAKFSKRFGSRPIFLTSTVVTIGKSRHTDVSLWHIIEGHINKKYLYETREIHRYKWLTFEEILRTDIRQLDPHMHRFIDKLKDELRSE